ncbi:MAG: hypothetical protein ACLQHK_01165 [Gallionellaceae bacterium]
MSVAAFARRGTELETILVDASSFPCGIECGSQHGIGKPMSSVINNQWEGSYLIGCLTSQNAGYEFGKFAFNTDSQLLAVFCPADYLSNWHFIA